MANIINGGKHADNKIDFQEFMIMPVGAESFAEGIRMVAEVFHSLKAVLKKAGHNTTVGDEGGFAPNLDNEEAIKFILDAIDKAGYTAGRDKDIAIALDCASSELFDEGGKKGYKFWKSNPDKLFSSQADDRALRRLGRQVSDHLDRGPARPGRLGRLRGVHQGPGRQGPDRRRRLLRHQHRSAWRKGIAKGCANSILIKVNQIGTLTETLEAVEMAQRSGLHRRDQPPLRRDRGRDHRRHRRGDQRRPDQDRLGQPLRPHRQVQPAPAHRGRAGPATPSTGPGPSGGDERSPKRRVSKDSRRTSSGYVATSLAVAAPEAVCGSCLTDRTRAAAEREPAALAELTGNLDGSLERAGEPFRNGKAQAQPRGTSPPGCRPNDRRARRGGRSSSSAMPIPRSSTVSKAEASSRVRLTPDGSSRFAVPCRIVEKVIHQLPEQSGLDPYPIIGEFGL